MERKLDTDAFALVPYFIAFLRGDAEAISRTAAVARSRRSTEDMIAHLEALVLARSGRLQEARRILDHRSIVLVDPMDAMARLQLARALALSGDTVKAKSAYDDVLALWKDADPNIPVVEEARAEYTRLPLGGAFHHRLLRWSDGYTGKRP
jgi:predicted Zn-dependent protease